WRTAHQFSVLCSSSIPLPPCAIRFPYTTLFRSIRLLAIASRSQNKTGTDSGRRVTDPHHSSQRKTHVVQQKAYTAFIRTVIRRRDRKSTRLNSSHGSISYAVICLKKNTEKMM